MANPSKNDAVMAYRNGKPLLLGTTQPATIADMGAITAYTAHASGAVAVTSNAATDLDTTAAALATLVTEVATMRTKLNSVLAALESHGLTADA